MARLQAAGGVGMGASGGGVMPRVSAGLLMFRRREERTQVLMAHPGGPFWKNKDDGAWSIPKGEVEDDEDVLDAARREFAEETGAQLCGEFRALAPRRLRSGKLVHAFAVEHDLDVSQLHSNTFPMQ